MTIPVATALSFISTIPRKMRGRALPHAAGSAGTHEHLDVHSRVHSKSLADLAKGESAAIASIAGTTSAKLHLMEMGLTPGTIVSVVRVAVFGGPMDITVRGYRLSLRREEAKAIQLRH